LAQYGPSRSARRPIRPSYGQGTYLAFLGRLTAEKGPESAIRIAHAAGMPLRVAAKLPRSERRYFKERLEPQIDGTQIKLIGEVNDEAKQPFLADAAALLFPIDWPEPFGLVMIEAMACGTPVIAFRSGSVPEVIDEGITGLVVDDEEQAVEALKRLGELDRRRVRERFEERFTAGRMAADYLSHYQSVVNGGSAEDRRVRLSAGEERGSRHLTASTVSGRSRASQGAQIVRSVVGRAAALPAARRKDSIPTCACCSQRPTTTTFAAAPHSPGSLPIFRRPFKATLSACVRGTIQQRMSSC
jgi:hypothetical protein